MLAARVPATSPGTLCPRLFILNAAPPLVWVRWGKELSWDRLVTLKSGGAGRLEKR